MDAQRKQLLRLGFAQRAFKEAQGLLGLIKLVDQTKLDHAYAGLWSGIAVCYSRPFQSANQLGPLSGDYAKFPENLEKLEAAHDELIRFRHALIAHRDLAAIDEIVREIPGSVDATEIVIVFKNGTFGLRRPETLLSTEFIDPVKELLEFQQFRIGKDILKLVRHFCGGEIFTEGHFRVTSTGLQRVPSIPDDLLGQS